MAHLTALCVGATLYVVAWTALVVAADRGWL
jgi:hypothetical protein